MMGILNTGAGQLARLMRNKQNQPLTINPSPTLQGATPQFAKNTLTMPGQLPMRSAVNPAIEVNNNANGQLTLSQTDKQAPVQPTQAMRQRQAYQAMQQATGGQLPQPQRFTAQPLAGMMTPDNQQSAINAVDRSMKLMDKDMRFGKNRINAKYAAQQLNMLLDKDTQDTAVGQRQNEQAQQDAQFGQEMAAKNRQDAMQNWMALQESTTRQPYYESEAALNNERVAQAKLPMPAKPEEWELTQDANGNPVQIGRQSGMMRLPQLSPDDQAINDYQAGLAELQAMPDGPDKQKRLSEWQASSEALRLRKMGRIK